MSARGSPIAVGAFPLVGLLIGATALGAVRVPSLKSATAKQPQTATQTA